MKIKSSIYYQQTELPLVAIIYTFNSNLLNKEHKYKLKQINSNRYQIILILFKQYLIISCRLSLYYLSHPFIQSFLNQGKKTQIIMESLEGLVFKGKSTQQPEIQLLNTPRQSSMMGEEVLAHQYVKILSQRIQEKINWEHDMFLLTGQSSYDGLKNAQISALGQKVDEKFNNILIPEQQFKDIIKVKKQNNQQARTPQIFSIPPNQPIQIQSFRIDTPASIIIGCSCKKSQCLKMYCECFKNRKICEGCQCCDCKNTLQNQNNAQKKRNEILKKEPNRFEQIEHYRGCKCTKSQCSKNYCQCFLNGLKCGKYCRCKNCNNGKKQRVLKRDLRGNRRRDKKKYTIEF